MRPNIRNIVAVVSTALVFGLLVDAAFICFDKRLAIDWAKLVWISHDYPVACLYALTFPGLMILPVVDKVFRR